MAISRYSSTPRLGFGSQLGTSSSIAIIRAAVASGELTIDTIVLRGAERLDTLAGAIYGDAQRDRMGIAGSTWNDHQRAAA
jgi:diketogulonate reductase-like aldo/keto reductase